MNAAIMATHDLSLVANPSRVVFSTPDGPISGWGVLRAASRISHILPQRPVLNLYRNPYHFTVVMLAALLRGQYCLLSSDHTPTRLNALRQEYDATCVGMKGDFSSEVEGVLLAEPDASGQEELPPPVLEAERLIAVVFTSGSTGIPVAHRKYWGPLVERSHAALALLDPALEAAIMIGTVPPYHMYGFETLVLQALHTRISTASDPHFYPADIRRTLAQASAPAVLVTTPLQISALLQSGLDIPPIRRIISASAPLEQSLAQEAEKTLATEVMEIYGSTETGSIATRRTISGATWTLYDGLRLEETAQGRAVLHTPGVQDYVLNDIVEMDGPRHFRLVGRVGDLIKLAGKRTSLAGLNAVLTGLENVRDGAFLPPPEQADGATARMQVFAVAPGLTGEEVLAALRQQIDPVFLPRRVVLLDAMPRNAVGKLTLGALRRLALAHGGEAEIGAFTIAADHPCLPGHFPGAPIVPGVILLDEIFALAGQTVSTLEQAKFLRPVRPGEEVSVSISHADPQRFRFVGRVEGAVAVRGVARHRAS
ncbi:AMP-binding protein [Kozakia baliensis]|uniref:AMP-binding protein n=1 Tax=Kozakia baliensis TaxID=153496 RepID=UPI0012489940|nr:AMP-binding protein [Kozakia baliensis]